MRFVDRVKAIFNTGKVISRARTDTKKAEDYTVDAQTCLDYYNSDPIIKRSITAIINKMFSDGYSINPLGEADATYENEKKQAIEFINKTKYYSKLKDATRSTLITGDGYQEVDTENVWNLSTPEISIKDIEDGVQYIQKISGRIVSRIDQERIIHYTVERIGDTHYGTGLVQSILFVSAIKKFAERNLGKRFEREKLRGFWVFRGMSDKEFDDMCDIITNAKDDPQKDIYLKGGDNADVTYSDLIKGDDMQFENLLKYLRQQQISGLMLHPINVGLTENSNRATAGEENRDFDEAIASYQSAIEDIVTDRLFKDILGLNNIEFELISVNKRDTLRELEIATAMNNLPTSINEVREEIGLPLIEEEWADEIRTGSLSNFDDFGNLDYENQEEEEPEQKPQEKNKSLNSLKKKHERAPKESPITFRDEKETYSIFRKWLSDIQRDLLEQINSVKEFKKDATDTGIIIDRILNKNTPDKFKTELTRQLNRLFNKGRIKVETELKRNIIANEDVLEYIYKYNFDLVKGLDNDLRNKLKQDLMRGIIEGQSINQIKNNLKNSLEITNNRAMSISRTETNRVANMGKLETYKSAGVKKIRAIAILDHNTSEICKHINGQTIDLSKGEKFRTMDGELFESPPFHPNCRTTTYSVFE